jgi:Asp-tRNA(Asn)/Glu-tRNA(Gln) amidotransferase A subunit family amidase
VPSWRRRSIARARGSRQLPAGALSGVPTFVKDLSQVRGVRHAVGLGGIGRVRLAPLRSRS